MDLLPSLIGLCGGIGAGAAYTMVRKLGERGEKGPFIVFFLLYLFLCCDVAMAAFLTIIR